MNSVTKVSAGPLEVGVCHPASVSKVDSVKLFARAVTRHPGTRFWMGQSVGVDTFAMLAYLAGAGYRIPMGTCVSLITLRTPAESASLCRSIVELTGRPFVYGMGVGSRRFQASIGSTLDAPATHALEHLREVRTRLTEATDFESDSVVLGLGVLRKAMAARASEADRLVTWMCPPNHLVDNLVPAAGEAAAGSPSTRKAPTVSHVLHVALQKPGGPDPRKLAMRAFSAHVRGGHYRKALAESGFGDVAGMSEIEVGSALLDSGTFFHGTSEEVVSHMRDLNAAGCSEIVLNVAATVAEEGHSTALADLDTLLGASREVTRR